MPKSSLADAPRGSLSLLSGLFPYLARYKLQCFLAGVALIVAAAATLAIPYAFKQMIDLGFNAGNHEGSRHINFYFLTLFAVACILGAATAARFYMVSWLGERVVADLRMDTYARVVRQSPAFFETTRSGEVLSRLTNDTTLIQTLIGTSISLALRNAVLFVGGLAMLFVTSVRLSAIIIGMLVLVTIPIIAFGRRVRKLSRSSQDRIADASAIAGEVLNAIPIVQAYNQERIETARFNRSINTAFDTALERIQSRAYLTVIAIILVFGAIVFVLWLGAHAVINGSMSGGDLGQFILYAGLVAGSIGALSEVMGDAQRAAGATERIIELKESISSVTNPVQPVELPIRTIRGAGVEFADVSFHYPSRPDQPSINRISLKIKPGETVAIVGPSGAGKTTLFQLLLRFYDPQQGVIRLDNIPITDLSLEALRDNIGVVPQDTVIFSANAMENIRFGRPDATDQEVIAAAQAAAADVFIEKLPEGYATFLGERGVRLSGGQRQRISIARALLKNPPLLLLDEATSALDAESERLVQGALEQAMLGRTTIVIAHRLATIQRADRILVLEQGQIIETGTHTQLVGQRGLYASLAALQFNVQ